MIKYNFIVDKETCFAYWAQSLIQWGWYFEKKEADYYRNLSEPFTDKEKESLELLKSILQKDENQFLWLWNRYVGKKIDNPEEFKDWETIRLTLSNKFEIIWPKEKQGLQRWQKILNKYSFQFLSAPYKKIYKFFKVSTPKNKQIIDVRLCFYWGKEFPTAHVQRNFKDLILLNISNTKPGKIERERVIGILAHETIHKIEYASSLSPVLLKNSYKRIIKPKHIGIKGIKWKHLLTETVIASIASLRFNTYIGRILVGDSKRQESDKIVEFDFKKNREKYGFLIRVVASRIEELTAKYLNNNKTIDQNYCDAIASAWLTPMEG